MRIVVTGAAGKIGREIIEDLSDSHELILVDRKSIPGHRSTTLDLSRCHKYTGSHTHSFIGSLKARAWKKAMNGAEVIVHLAEDPDQNAPHRQVLENNIQATWNVFHAAATHKVRRVVYASSKWAVKLVEQQLSPGCYSDSARR